MAKHTYIKLMPKLPPSGLTLAQYHWYLDSCIDAETTLVEMLVSYDFINNANPEVPGQGNVLREWIIQEHAKNPAVFLNQYAPNVKPSEKEEALLTPEPSPKMKTRSF